MARGELTCHAAPRPLRAGLSPPKLSPTRAAVRQRGCDERNEAAVMRQVDRQRKRLRAEPGEGRGGVSADVGGRGDDPQVGLGMGSEGGVSSMGQGMLPQVHEGRRGRKKRKRNPAPATQSQLEARARELIANAYAASSQRVIKTALGALYEFEAAFRDQRPQLFHVPRWGGDITASAHNEMTLILFACWLLDHGLAPSTIGTYVSLVKTNLGTAFGWALTCKETQTRLPRLLKGIRRMHKRVRKKRLGWRARYERLLRDQLGKPVGWGACTQTGVRCALRQAVMRGADCMPETQAAWDPERHATVGDLRWETRPAPHLAWKVQPAKKSEQQGKTEWVYLPEGDGVTDAYSAIARMLEARERAKGRGGGRLGDGEPLFAHTDGSAWVVNDARTLFKRSASAIGVDPTFLGAHSGRVGGATDLFASDCPAALMQIQGRWCAHGTRTQPRTRVLSQSFPTTSTPPNDERAAERAARCGREAARGSDGRETTEYQRRAAPPSSHGLTR